MKKYGSVCVPTDKTNSTIEIKIEDYKRWVSNHLLKAEKLALHPKLIAMFEDANKLPEKMKMDCQFKKKICNTITRNASDPLSRVINQIPKENQQERGIPNQVGNPRDEIYSNVIQDRLSWGKDNA